MLASILFQFSILNAPKKQEYIAHSINKEALQVIQ